MTFNVVLFLHITAAIAGFMVAAVLHVGLLQMRRARTIAELRAWEPTITRLEPMFPLIAATLVGLGAWLLHLSGGEFGWSDGWVITAVTTLAFVEVIGAGVLGRRSKALMARVRQAPDGPVPDDVRRAVLDPPLWLCAHLTTAAVIGIVCLMATKPAGVISVVVILVASALGALSAVPFLRAPAVHEAKPTELPAQPSYHRSSA
jgi:hypothetical protein